jgi:hypothetical protein
MKKNMLNIIGFVALVTFMLGPMTVLATTYDSNGEPKGGDTPLYQIRLESSLGKDVDISVEYIGWETSSDESVFLQSDKVSVTDNSDGGRDYTFGFTCDYTSCGVTCGSGTCMWSCEGTCNQYTCGSTCGSTCTGTCGSTCATCTGTCGFTCGGTCGVTCGKIKSHAIYLPMPICQWSMYYVD